MRITTNYNFAYNIYNNQQHNKFQPNFTAVTKVAAKKMVVPAATFVAANFVPNIIKQDEGFKENTAEVHKEISDIQTEEEYNQVASKILNKHTSDLADIAEENWDFYYPKCPYKYAPIMLYCGVGDISYDLNNYLSQNKLPIYLDKVKMEQYIRTLKYSLNELDKQYGQHEGLVYRIGYFSPEPIQYRSTSFEPLEQYYLQRVENFDKYRKTHNGNDKYEKEYLNKGQYCRKFHIIHTKHGHKIYNFQEDYLQPVLKEDNIRNSFLDEKEILLDNRQRFKSAEGNPVLEKAKQELAQTLLKEFQNKNIEGFSNIQEILPKIEIWEEVE